MAAKPRKAPLHRRNFTTGLPYAGKMTVGQELERRSTPHSPFYDSCSEKLKRLPKGSCTCISNAPHGFFSRPGRLNMYRFSDSS